MLNFCATDHGTSAMFMTEKKSRSRWFGKLSAGASNEEHADNYYSEE